MRNIVKIGCFTVNARSLHNKEINVHEYICNKEINVHEYIWNKEMNFGVITGTWYKDNNWLLSALNTLGLKQDAINHNDSQTGGGLSLVFRSQYPCERLKISKHRSLEFGLWKLNIKGIHTVVLGIIDHHTPNVIRSQTMRQWMIYSTVLQMYYQTIVTSL